VEAVLRQVDSPTIRSLYREDHLSQIEIAALLNRHKSFMCRRLGESRGHSLII
jgi:hypothetical protein